MKDMRHVIVIPPARQTKCIPQRYGWLLKRCCRAVVSIVVATVTVIRIHLSHLPALQFPRALSTNHIYIKTTDHRCRLRPRFRWNKPPCSGSSFDVCDSSQFSATSFPSLTSKLQIWSDSGRRHSQSSTTARPSSPSSFLPLPLMFRVAITLIKPIKCKKLCMLPIHTESHILLFCMAKNDYSLIYSILWHHAINKFCTIQQFTPT